MKKIVMITGGTNCGKDTIAELLKLEAELKDIDTLVVSPSYVIRDMISVLLNEGPVKIEHMKKELEVVRNLMKKIANIARQEINDQVFINSVIKDIKRDKRMDIDNDFLIIIPGIRFHIEIKELLNFVERDGRINDIELMILESNLVGCKTDSVDEVYKDKGKLKELYRNLKITTIKNEKGKIKDIMDNLSELLFKWFGK